MKILRYTLVAALAVAMSGGNQMFAMTSGSSSTGASSSSAASDTKEAKSASSSSASTSTVAAEIQGLDEAIAAVDSQLKAIEPRPSTGGRFGTVENPALQPLLRIQNDFLRRRARFAAPAVAPVVREQKAEALGCCDAAIDSIGDRLGTRSGKIAAGTLVYSLCCLGTILSCLLTSDLGYRANCPDLIDRHSLFAVTQLTVGCLLTWLLWKKAGRDAARAKAAEAKEARPAH